MGCRMRALIRYLVEGRNRVAVPGSRLHSAVASNTPERVHAKKKKNIARPRRQCRPRTRPFFSTPFAAICERRSNGKKLDATAQALRARHMAPGDWNQALMELGETILGTPQIPRCGVCPVSRVVPRARIARNLRCAKSPRRAVKRAPVKMRIAAAILTRSVAGRTIRSRRIPAAHDDVLFSRMWQFPAVEACSAIARGGAGGAICEAPAA